MISKKANMQKVILDMSMSLDGFISGSSGDDGLHDWVFGGSVPVEAGGITFHLASETSAKVFKGSVEATGAYIVGKVTFAGAGENPIFQQPTFVLTHEKRERLDKQGTTITFVADGIESALRQAKNAAGNKDVCVFGGASMAHQYLQAGLVDEIHISMIPKLMGSGLQLFDGDGTGAIALDCTGVIAGLGVTHLQYRVVR